jgi:hypothetical protein
MTEFKSTLEYIIDMQPIIDEDEVFAEVEKAFPYWSSPLRFMTRHIFYEQIGRIRKDS